MDASDRRGVRLALRTIAIGASLLAVVGLSAQAWGVSAPGKKAKKFHLTALTKKDASIHETGDKIVLALQKKGKTVGTANFPNCTGTGTSFICGGKVTVKHVGSGLNTLITWSCPPEPPFTCGPGIGTLTKGPNGAGFGSIRLKVQPTKIKKGKRFPALVTKKRTPPPQ